MLKNINLCLCLLSLFVTPLAFARSVSQIGSFATWQPGAIDDIKSTDPAGIGFNPDTNRLIICDSEINEGDGNEPPIIDYFEDRNIFSVTTAGTPDPLRNYLTYPNVGSNSQNYEPTGIVYSKNYSRYYVVNDRTRKIHYYDAGFQQNSWYKMYNNGYPNVNDPEGITIDDVNNIL